MKRFKHVFLFVALYGLLLSSVILITHLTTIPVVINRFAISLSAITLITLVTYIVVMIGEAKGSREGGIYLLLALGGKFILYLVFILIMWAPEKSLSKPFIIEFFVLYLILTFTLVSILYKVLKSN